MDSYDLKPDGKIERIGFGYANPIQGTEPWFNNIDEAFSWQFVGGVWSKWEDKIEEWNPVFLSSQDISNKPGSPNIERKAFILGHEQRWLTNELFIELGIRHIKDGVKFLDYDTRITLEATGNWYELFLTKQSVDGLNNVQALQFLVTEADNAGLIDELIEIY